MTAALVISATRNVLSLGILSCAGEATGQFNKLPSGVGALIGIVSFAVTHALRPLWTAIQLSANFHPVGFLFFALFAVITECLVASLIVAFALPRMVNLQQTALTTVETCGAAAVVTMLLIAGFNALRI